MNTFKSIAKALGIAVAVAIVGSVILGKLIGFFGILLALALAAGGFLFWLALDHGDIFQFLFPGDPGDQERAQRKQDERGAKDFLDRSRRGDRRDST